MTVTVRQADVSQLDAVAELFDLYRQFYKLDADLGLARRYLAAHLEHGTSTIFLACDEHRTALGFTQLYRTYCSLAAGPILVLYDLFVRTEARRAGIGRALMEAAREHAVATRVRRIDLTTAKANKPAQILYESLGYERDNDFHVYSLNVTPAPPD